MPDDGNCVDTPNEPNQLNSGCRVKKITAQNTHFVNPPPMVKVIVPSRLRLSPASTKDRTAADGAKNSSTEMTSFSNCGAGIGSWVLALFVSGCHLDWAASSGSAAEGDEQLAAMSPPRYRSSPKTRLAG